MCSPAGRTPRSAPSHQGEVVMFRSIGWAAALAVAIGRAASAEEFAAEIRKIEGGKVTFTKVSLKDREKGREEHTLPVAAKVKVVALERKPGKGKKGKFKLERGADLPGGLENKDLMKGLAAVKTRLDTGVPARLITDDEGKTIKEVQVLLPKPKKRP